MNKHRNIPIFIPHYGCGNECIFCNQRFITDKTNNITQEYIVGEIEANLKYIKPNANATTEIAFFGGSFTGIDHNTMLNCLNTANQYVKRGIVDSIRISTRPDYISEEILALLAEYNVKSIELGIQSMDDGVLSASKRGHTSADTEKACRLIVENDFNLTGQMMIGMYTSNAEDEINTAKKIIEMGAISARIYPTIVIKNTELYALRQCGQYTELSLDEAVRRTAAIKRLFDDADVKILRMGLCATDVFEDENNFYGPYHPAFGELVQSQILLEDMICAIDKHIESNKNIKTLTITSNNKEISKIVGQKGKNRVYLKEKYKDMEIIYNVGDNSAFKIN